MIKVLYSGQGKQSISVLLFKKSFLYFISYILSGVKIIIFIKRLNVCHVIECVLDDSKNEVSENSIH